MAAKRRKPERSAQYESPTYRDLVDRVARAVHRLRAKRGWTQEEAAHRCGMSTRLFQQIESGESNLTFTTVARLCEGLEVDVSTLVARPRRRAAS